MHRHASCALAAVAVIVTACKEPASRNTGSPPPKAPARAAPKGPAISIPDLVAPFDFDDPMDGVALSPDGRWVSGLTATNDDAGAGSQRALIVEPAAGATGKTYELTLPKATATYTWAPSSKGFVGIVAREEAGSTACQVWEWGADGSARHVGDLPGRWTADGAGGPPESALKLGVGERYSRRGVGCDEYRFAAGGDASGVFVTGVAFVRGTLHPKRVVWRLDARRRALRTIAIMHPAAQFAIDDQGEVALSWVLDFETNTIGDLLILRRSESAWVEAVRHSGWKQPLPKGDMWRSPHVVDAVGLWSVDLQSGEKTLVAEDPNADVEPIVQSATTGTVLAVGYTRGRWEWTAAADTEEAHAVVADLSYISETYRGQVALAARSRDDRRWLVSVGRDDRPWFFATFDRATRALEPSFAKVPGSRYAWSHPTVRSHHRVVPAGDGLSIPTFVTLPAETDSDGDGIPDAPLPTIVWVHGGPKLHDRWEYHPVPQLFANRGYAVLRANYRGSSGYGAAHRAALDGQYGTATVEDVEVVREWAIKAKIADPDRIAVGGDSYGGYVAMLLMRAPTAYRCGVSFNGSYDLRHLLTARPEHAGMFGEAYWRELTKAGWPGEVRAGSKVAIPPSPIDAVHDYHRPLLIVQGTLDAKGAVDAQRFVDALRRSSAPVSHAVIEEPHVPSAAGWARQLALAERFLRKCVP